MTTAPESEVRERYLRHRAGGLEHDQAVELVALDTGLQMHDVENALRQADEVGGAAKRWRRPRKRVLDAIHRSDMSDR